jgi:hypothetical protein
VTDIYTVKRKDNVTNGDMKDLNVNKEKDVYESKRVRLTKERKEREIDREICSDTHTHTHTYTHTCIYKRERVRARVKERVRERVKERVRERVREYSLDKGGVRWLK